eukprot:9486815-Pyramimonas_sp.AAC.1
MHVGQRCQGVVAMEGDAHPLGDLGQAEPASGDVVKATRTLGAQLVDRALRVVGLSCGVDDQAPA